MRVAAGGGLPRAARAIPSEEMVSSDRRPAGSIRPARRTQTAEPSEQKDLCSKRFPRRRGSRLPTTSCLAGDRVEFQPGEPAPASGAVTLEYEQPPWDTPGRHRLAGDRDLACGEIEGVEASVFSHPPKLRFRSSDQAYQLRASPLKKMEDPVSLWTFTESDVLERVPDKKGRRLVGEYSCQQYWIVKERIKRLIRSMTQQVDDVHMGGSCLSRFGHRNWEVTSSGLAVHKGLSLIKKTDDFIKQNYDDLHSIIRNTIFRKFTIQEIPADFKELLSLMKHRPLNNGYLIRNFAALIPLGNRILFFMKGFEHIMFYLGSADEDMKDRIMSKLPYSKRWFDILKGNYLLEYSFNYKTRDASGSAEGFMEYYRDSNFHRMDVCFQILEVGGYSAEEYELIFTVKYPLYLTAMQEELHNSWSV